MGKKNEAQREKHKAYMKEYRKAHREELKKYREAHREEHKAYMKEYNKTHEEERKAYREKNKDKISQYDREYRKTHRKRRNEICRAYQTRKKQEKILQQQQEEQNLTQKILQEEQMPNIQDVDELLLTQQIQERLYKKEEEAEEDMIETQLYIEIENLKEDKKTLINELQSLKRKYDFLEVSYETLSKKYEKLEKDSQIVFENNTNIIGQRAKYILENKALERKILKLENNNQGYSNGIKPIPTPCNGYLMRSKSEARIGYYLSYIGAEWSYEPAGFKSKNSCYEPDFGVSNVELPNGKIIDRLWIEAKPGYDPSLEDIQKMKNFIYGNTSKIQNPLLLMGWLPAKIKNIYPIFERSRNNSIPFYSLKTITGEDKPCFLFKSKTGKIVLRTYLNDINEEEIEKIFKKAINKVDKNNNSTDQSELAI